MSQRDDILLGGRNQAEHDETLRIVLKRASDYGVTLNSEKCRFGVREIEFYGYLFTEGTLKQLRRRYEPSQKVKHQRPKRKSEVFSG